MTESSQPPRSASPDRRRPGRGLAGAIRGMLPAAAVVAAVLAGTTLLGVVAGFAWAGVAPRALVVVIGRGSADVVNPETNAFIAADGWFVLLTAIGGVASGLLGYLFAVRQRGAAAMAAVLVGGLPAALVAMWIGQQSGTAGFNHTLQIGQPGVLAHAPLMLGGIGALAFWSMFAGLTAGGIEAVVRVRGRQAARARLMPYGPPPVPGAGEPAR